MPKLIISAPFFNTTEKDLLKTFEILAKSNADEILLRDVSCQKREPSIEFYKKTIKLLHDNGKKIILNTPLIVRQEDKVFNKFSNLVDIVEINNIGYLPFLKNTKTILGPQLRMYNCEDSKVFEDSKFERFVVPYGLTKEQTQELLHEIKHEGEVFIFGLESVALSWDCFLASFLEKNRHNCQKACFNHASGLNISSLNSIPLFKTMGTEVFSQKAYSIINQIDYLKKNGVNHFRANPHLIFEKSQLGKRINDLKEIIESNKNTENFWWLEKCNGTFYEKTPGYEYVGDKKCL